jgi:hypothetical protein
VDNNQHYRLSIDDVYQSRQILKMMYMVVHQSQHLDRRHKVLMPNKNILLKHYQVLLVIFMISFSCSRQVEENEILRLSILSRYMITKVAIVFSVFAIVGVLFSVQVVRGESSQSDDLIVIGNQDKAACLLHSGSIM